MHDRSMHESMVQIGVGPDLRRDEHARALAKILRGEVRFGRHDRMLYATDASIYQVEPIGVVVPRDREDLRAAVRYCSEHRLPMLPRGGGTSLAGQCVAEAVVLDTSAGLRGIGAVRDGEEGAVCDVEAGVTIDALNAAVAERGVFFAPDPSTFRQANVGGCIGNNAAGTRSIRYGRTAENVEAIDALLADGTPVRLERNATDPIARRLADGVAEIVRGVAPEIRARFPRTLRRNAGYALDMMLDAIEAGGVERMNLAHLLCGAEGTLALTEAATVRLHPVLPESGLVVVGFASVDDAIACVPALLQLEPTAVELLDDMVLDLARGNRAQRAAVDLLPRPTDDALRAALYVEFRAAAGASETIAERAADVRRLLASLPAGARASMRLLDEPRDEQMALELRRAGEPLLHGIPGERKPLGFIEDNVVPVERLGEFVTRLRSIVEARGTRAAFYAHASVGVLHVRPLLSLRRETDRGAMEEIAVAAADLARELGGVMSGEHGDGRARGPLLERHFGPRIMEAFRAVKTLFDPHGLLNPGNIVAPLEVPSIHERTRIRPGDQDVHVAEMETCFGYDEADGFAHAIELCNGAGVCRRMQGGTMCPSYRATLDERHSTRGRANALRLALSGQLGGDGSPALGDAETLATLDLCLSCKACKSECPSNVDLGKYKAEYLAQTYRAAGGPPLAARMMAAVRHLNRLGSATTPLSNVLASAPPLRPIANRLLGLAPARSLPRFARSLPRRLAADPATNAGLPEDAPRVTLFGDCFTMYNEPEIGHAGCRVLNAFGYRVELLDVGCCARPHVSLGLLDAARGRVERLGRDVRAVDGAVLALEPSCLSMMHDEWHALRLSDDEAREALRRVGAGAASVEAFLLARIDEHPRRPALRAPAGTLAVHGHCHDKALGTAAAASELLARLAGSERVRRLDTGCCGMAGSFGYARHRFELSNAIGELSLFPAARALGEDDVVVATGTSCRHQLADGVGMRAEHPVRVLEAMLDESAAGAPPARGRMHQFAK